MPTSPPRDLADEHSWVSELKKTVKLAVPLVVTFIGYQIMTLCDTFVSAHMSTQDLASVSLGGALYWVCTIFPLGLLLSLDPLITQSLGSQNPQQARFYCRQGLSLALIFSCIFMPIVLMSTADYWPWIDAQSPTALGVTSYVQGRIFAVPCLLLHTCARCFLQAHEKTTPILLATLSANILNFPLSVYLAGGDTLWCSFGLPSLGLFSDGYGVWGIGIASSIAASLEVIFLLCYASYQEKVAMLPTSNFTQIKKLIMMGLPIGGSLISEGGVFSASTLIVSAWSIIEIGAHQITLQISSCSFTIYLGIASATTVRVGHAVGAKQWSRARKVAGTGVILGLLVSCAAACIFILNPTYLPSLISQDPKVIQQASTLLLISAAFQLFDGIQVIYSGALRGAGFMQLPFWSALTSHWGVGLPCALLFAFHYQYKTSGLWWGLCCGLATALIILSYGFYKLSKKAELSLIHLSK